MRPEEAAKRLGMSTQTLRLALQQGKFDFGVAVKTSENRFAYYINPTRLEIYLQGADYGEVIDLGFDGGTEYDTEPANSIGF